MGVKVKLDDIIEGMEFQSDESLRLLNIKTGKVIFIDRYFLTQAEDGEPFDHMNDWMQEQMEIAYDVAKYVENYRELPTSFEINEYEIMEDFCYEVKSNGKRDRLLRAINGRGAFRRFKNTAIKLELIEDWYDYRDERYKQIAIAYCKGLGLNYVE
ncbi:UPF0158 family protein [Oceanobacillus halophilus]|uniref:Uncharacterized protein n=1 Tax=Oceanobacillus halophilus TaxID=930130 RepID=A0A495A4Y3_9BACI|nr:UPF0158 family protein [Oceanobacillus halophilus]RKQ34766.1 hypothetical protein D8M06_07190 [Oceanobacillus halophilus]